MHSDGAGEGWDVVRPARRTGAPVVDGVRMAGYRCPESGGLDMHVFPQPFLTVVLGLGGPPLSVERDQGNTGSVDRRAVGSLVAGPVPGPTRVRGASFACVELRLSPVAAYSVLDAAPVDLHTTVAGLEDLWGGHGGRLSERLAGAGTWPERFALVETFLAGRSERGPSVDAEVVACWSHIVARRGRVRVGALAAATGWSRKRLWSRFTAQLGLTPKRAAMLVRFHRAARRLAAGADAAQTALACGYVDQSHLHRDVRAFTGCTPSALARTVSSIDPDADTERTK
ncbi:helix-turn-helix domain-containing protein, partial [Streptomyces aureocirculatus]|uniref:helix-turn-helix domain-containing protein n=1 Tax=Streptomyces aureocirculatus TaxID=67275 RepID=UPI0004CBE655